MMSNLEKLAYRLNEGQRERLKSLLLEFKNEGIIVEEWDEFSIDEIINDIDLTTHFEKEREKSCQAADRGETTIPKDDWGVHETHCCSKHGCKYGHIDCPVAIGLTKQACSCEYCDENRFGSEFDN